MLILLQTLLHHLLLLLLHISLILDHLLDLLLFLLLWIHIQIGASWYLGVYNPEINEVEDMRDGLIAMIVICAFLLSGASLGRRIEA